MINFFNPVGSGETQLRISIFPFTFTMPVAMTLFQTLREVDGQVDVRFFGEHDRFVTSAFDDLRSVDVRCIMFMHQGIAFDKVSQAVNRASKDAAFAVANCV